jgi:phenazine biosynthesis protein phzE
MSEQPATADLLDRVLGLDPPPFALLHRPHTSGPDALDVLVGELSTPRSLAGLNLADEAPAGAAHHELLALVPYRQIVERGFDCADDGEPLLAMTVTGQAVIGLEEALRRLPDERVTLTGGRFAEPDAAYTDTVRRIIADEIGGGLGANFVIKRDYLAEITGYTPLHAMSVFRRLIRGESGAYWTFLVHTGDRTFVGATPERHVSLDGGTAVMNPISGTYRYGPGGPALPELMEFLADRKESDELYMVVDEELKMMAQICDGGGRVVGPHLREMARLAHTEYFIEGRCDRDPREILHRTMFAPTVTGSPLESACRVIARYEPNGRGYYSGVIALIGRDADGGRTMDSSILIRTADISASGHVRIGVGATLVRHSDPESEVAEVRAKLAGLLAALRGGSPVRLSEDPQVRAALRERNTAIASFWLAEENARQRPGGPLAGRRVLIVDAEDTFTSMIDHQLRSLGLAVTVRRYDAEYNDDGYDLVVMGPGPGDPRATDDPKIRNLGQRIGALLAERRPFLAVCLSHQVLSLRLGFELRRREVPNQGIQRDIELFGARERVGFYNTFAARSDADKAECQGVGMVEASRDVETGEVHALRGPHFASIQFHAESLLTQDGVRILDGLIREVLEL